MRYLCGALLLLSGCLFSDSKTTNNGSSSGTNNTTNNNTTTNNSTSTNNATTAPIKFVQIDAGANGTCGLTETGEVVCWGHNDTGKFDAPDNIAFASISVGKKHSCGIDSDGEAYCWGNNRNSESSPPEVRLDSISAGSTHSCGVVSGSGIHRCWGNQELVQESSDVVSKVATGPFHTCVITESGDVRCWGAPELNGRITTAQNGPYTDLSASQEFNCGILESKIRCWGTKRASFPTGDYENLTTGDSHACALTLGGRIDCWGNDGANQVSGAPDEREYTQITAGDHHTCALHENGSVFCWGENSAGRLDAPNQVNP